MKLNKIFAVLSATAIAGSMAISASADTLISKTGNESSAEIYKVDFTGYTGEDLEKVVRVEADVIVDSGFCNGTMGGNISGTWSSTPNSCENSDTELNTWSWDIADGGLANYVLDEDTGEVSSQPYMEIQLWWVNPFYVDDVEGDPGTAKLEAVRLLDADGNEVAPSGNDASTETPSDTDKPADSTPSTDDKPSTDNSTSTGLVGLSLAGLAVAGAAVVASKKKN